MGLMDMVKGKGLSNEAEVISSHVKYGFSDYISETGITNRKWHRRRPALHRVPDNCFHFYWRRLCQELDNRLRCPP